MATEQILEGDQIFTRYTAISIGQPRRKLIIIDLRYLKYAESLQFDLINL